MHCSLPASPIRSSPLANPPILSPGRYSSRPTPIPLNQRKARRTSLHLSSIPPTTPHQDDNAQPTISPTTTSPPLSRSHPLLGSFSLSLLHSRMSHAHTPHSVSPSPTSGFSLHLGALGKGRSCPPELRCPAHEVFPFAATYYDLEDGGRKSSTPWVGNIDVEKHFYDKYTSDNVGDGASLPALPPDMPGFRVAPLGQLQLLIKTPDSAVKVFLVPYDLRSLSPGGRMLTRERTYVASPTPHDTSSSPSSVVTLGGREKLRYSIQLQFICLQRSEAIVPTRTSSTTRRLRSQGVSEPPTDDRQHKDYYLSRSIKVIFSSNAPESDETTRTERNDEVVESSISMDDLLKRGRISTASPISFTPRSPHRDEWEVVRRKWSARREVEAATAIDFFARPDVDEIRPATPPVSLLSSQVLSPPTSSTSLPAESSAATSPLAILPNIKPLIIHTSGRVSPSQPPSIKTPPPHRYPTRQKMRRGSGSLDERELSEKLRHLKLNQE